MSVMFSEPEHEVEVFAVRSRLYLPGECETASILNKDCATFLVDATEQALHNENHRRLIFGMGIQAEDLLRVQAWLAGLPTNVPTLLDAKCVRVLAQALQGDLDKYERELYWAAVTSFHIVAHHQTSHSARTSPSTQLLSRVLF